ncbi:hypothetical protein AB0E59_17725 [Lentzea sp. NPDC034063]
MYSTVGDLCWQLVAGFLPEATRWPAHRRAIVQLKNPATAAPA